MHGTLSFCHCEKCLFVSKVPCKKLKLRSKFLDGCRGLALRNADIPTHQLHPVYNPSKLHYFHRNLKVCVMILNSIGNMEILEQINRNIHHSKTPGYSIPIAKETQDSNSPKLNPEKPVPPPDKPIYVPIYTSLPFQSMPLAKVDIWQSMLAIHVR